MPVVRIGLQNFEYFSSYAGHHDNTQEMTLSYLKERLPQFDFQVEKLNTEELADAIMKKGINFFFSSSGFYVAMEEEGVRDIATLVSEKVPDPNNATGAAFVVLKDRKDLNSIEDLRGKTAIATSPQNFMSFQIPMGEIEKRGYNPYSFFLKINFSNYSPKKVIDAVYEGKADVGFLRACNLEVLERQVAAFKDKFKVLGERKEGLIPCRYSTDLYPGWVIGVVKGTSPELTHEVAQALLEMDPKLHSGYTWTIATDYSGVRNLFKSLKIGPYAYLNQWTLERILNVAWPFLLAFAVGLLSLLYHLWRVEKLVVKRTRQLTVALAKQKESERLAAESSEKLDTLNRIGMVSQLSSIFAHEMRQPLAAMKYTTHALLSWTGKNALDKEKLERAVKALRCNIERADSILSKVRQYAKGQSKRDLVLNWKDVIENCVSDLKNTGRFKHPIDLRNSGKGEVMGDPLELQIVLLNLVKNAEEAAPDNTPIVISAGTEGKEAFVTVENEGAKLTPEELQAISEPLRSKKEHGLGLGMQIVRSVAEAHKGRLKLEARPEGGLTITLFLPLCQPTPG